MRKNTNDAYYFFYDCILRCVVGKPEWKRLLRIGQPMCKLVSVSDEAFALLLLENSWKRWEYIHKNKITDGKERKKVKGRWTNDTRTGSCEFDGWDHAGLERYNALTIKVDEDREENLDFDLQYNRDIQESCKPTWNTERQCKMPSKETLKRQTMVIYNGYERNKHNLSLEPPTKTSCEEMNASVNIMSPVKDAAEKAEKLDFPTDINIPMSKFKNAEVKQTPVRSISPRITRLRGKPVAASTRNRASMDMERG